MTNEDNISNQTKCQFFINFFFFCIFQFSTHCHSLGIVKCCISNISAYHRCQKHPVLGHDFHYWTWDWKRAGVFKFISMEERLPYKWTDLCEEWPLCYITAGLQQTAQRIVWQVGLGLWHYSKILWCKSSSLNS